MKTASDLEGTIQADIRKAVGLFPHVRLWRNNRGAAWMGQIVERAGTTIVLANARPVEFGLTNGASDLIGLTQIVITPEMIGRTLAVFTAIEVKRPGVGVPEHQRRFIDFVRGFGALADVARSSADAVRIVEPEVGEMMR